MTAAQPDLTDLTATAERVAGEAAHLVRDRYRSILAGYPVDVDTKTSQTDVVTAVDREAEQLIRELLAELRPGDPVLGEEEGGGESAAGVVTWVVDPIDGTVNFLYGYPWFAVSVAAQIDGVSVAGAVVEPISERHWSASRGIGAWLDGQALATSSPDGVELALLATGFAYRAERRSRQAAMIGALLGRVRDIRRTGSACLDLCAVAAGWVDAYVEHGLSRWDWAAAALIAEEAGAVVSLPGEDLDLGADAILAASPTIVEPLRQVLTTCAVTDV